jgi:hypothetical protein
VLTFKVEAGGSTERDTWVAALEQAKQMGAEAGRRGASADKLEQLKRVSYSRALDITLLWLYRLCHCSVYVLCNGSVSRTSHAKHAHMTMQWSPVH